ncbi:MAG TPA: ATP-binding cassette domain-containing protein [Arachidicoccus soli]|nr:ATP-binding cassette domain-containing protein [Arachidicoccus soli]
MQITLADAGKRFNRDWIFKSLDYTFVQGNAYAIIGNNGSGKSTLLQSISGAVELSAGQCNWSMDLAKISTENVFRYMAIAAPSLELVEEMTAKEFLNFHSVFKPFVSHLSINEILELVQLSSAAKKQIRYFSSGMKQRVKLAQAIFSDAPVILLDEPCTNLDRSGYNLYHQLIKDFCKEKLVIVSSNDEEEYFFCSEKIDIRDYKIS